MKIKKPDHEFREKVILELAKIVHGSKSLTYDELDQEIKDFYAYTDYITLVRPLLTLAKKVDKLTYGQIAIKYGITKRQVSYHFCCATIYVSKENDEEE